MESVERSQMRHPLGFVKKPCVTKRSVTRPSPTERGISGFSAELIAGVPSLRSG